MKYTNALRTLGLSQKDARIYEALLKHGQMGILALSKAADVHRPGLYTHLPRLVSRGLVNEVRKGKRTEYVANSPHNLEPFVKDAQETLENIVEDLAAEFSRKQIVPKIETYYGKDGISKIFTDVVMTLEKDEQLYRFSVRNEEHQGYLSKAYVELRDKKRIERLVITNEMGKKRHEPSINRFAKVLKGDYDVFGVTKMIYKDKIAFIDYENEVGFIIYNERMAAMEKEVFLSLYRML